MKAVRLFVAVLVLLSSTLAFARFRFDQTTFEAGQFRDIEKLQQICTASASASFWCGQLEAPLTLITAKGDDFFINERGEFVAIFAKVNKGQDLRGNYTADQNQNLVPVNSPVPAGALLLNGEYIEPQNPESTWERLDDATYKGTFTFQLNDIDITKVLTISNIRQTLDVAITAERTGATANTTNETLQSNEAVTTDEATTESSETSTNETSETTETLQATTTSATNQPIVLQYVLPGIARTESPLVKVAQGTNAPVNIVGQPITNPSYISLQTSRAGQNSFALILRPAEGETDVEAQIMQGDGLPAHTIALQQTLSSPSTTLNLRQYNGNNELVRYTQEGYRELPGLFQPNIIGQLSLGVLWFLERIHSIIGNWGLSIIALTLIFRILIWPLINTQTKSMYAMQSLQPEIQALQKKHKDNQEKLTQETMKLYREKGVNPAGGCLPVFLQMPLFIILYNVFRHYEFNEGFLWLPDLGQADPFYILPIVYLGVILLQSWLSAKGNPQMLRQQLLINVAFIFFFIGFPSGVILYYTFSMAVQAFQYWLIQRGQPKPPTKALAK
ncbi:MAG: YidC/Oxa1 family membrane protein insertase [Trueperaceae bacterium]